MDYNAFINSMVICGFALSATIFSPAIISKDTLTVDTVITKYK